MRKKCFLCILLLVLTLFAGTSLPVSARGATASPADWAWLVDQVKSGAKTITLPNDIVCEGDEGLSPAETVRIEGGIYSITGTLVDGGTVVFKDVRLLGTHGVGDENGGDALTLRGEGTIAVLMGATRAEGGKSGTEGESGGDGVQLLGNKQGLILNNTATAAGGIGRGEGGAGIRAHGCGNSILMTDNAAAVGSLGLGIGGPGISAPACCKVTLESAASAKGGNAQHDAGEGILSQPCGQDCDQHQVISLAGTAMSIGGIGQSGGNGVEVIRTAVGDAEDLLLNEACMLIGGDGETSGSGLKATNAAIAYSGTPQAFGGLYYATQTSAALLDGCTETGRDALAVQEGKKTETYPASGVASIINSNLGQRSNRYAPQVLEDGLTVTATETKLNGVSVEKGSTSQAKVSGSGLKIFMFNGTLEKRMQFQQRLMSDGAEGTRLVLIGSVSDEWPTVESTPAALRRLVSLGVTQLGYTTVAPAYRDRVLDIEGILAALDAYEAEHSLEVPKVMFGTADDAVIYVLADGTRDYQEGQMAEIVRPVE